MPNITKTYMDKSLPEVAAGAQKLIFDDQIKGFGVRVTSGSKTFILDRKLGGKTIRKKIGRYPDWSVQQARERARQFIVQLDQGIDIRLQDQASVIAAVTLGAVFEQFIAERQLKSRTILDYRRYLTYYFADWLDRPASKIDPTMIVARYKKISESTSGKAQASSAMRALRSILNYAIATYGKETMPENPVLALTSRRAWHRDQSKTDHLKIHEIGAFVGALRKLPNFVMAGYLEFTLFTGARRSEAALLEWRDVDFVAGTITFRETKNHTNRVVPMAPHIRKLLTGLNGGSKKYVFWTLDRNGKETHIKEPRKAMNVANAAAGSSVTVHGLRRTFSTVLESLDCPAYPLKSLLGHSLKSDVTSAHYTQISVERLRPWLERYEADLLEKLSGVDER